MTIPFRAGPLVGLTLATCTLIACGGSSNNATKATATRAAGNASPAAAAPRATAPPSRTPGALPTISAEIEALGQRLIPRLIQTSELPPSMKSFQQGGIFPATNEDYARNAPNAAEITARLVKDGRIGGVQTSWTPTGQFQPGQQTLSSLVDGISEFHTADGAKDGLSLIFSQINSTKSPQGEPIASKPLDAGSYGEETQAYRVETSYTAAVSASPTPINQQVKQVVYIAAFRRSTVVAFINISAINMDPSIDDLKQLLQLQDQKLKDAGY